MFYLEVKDEMEVTAILLLPGVAVVAVALFMPFASAAFNLAINWVRDAGWLP